MSKFYSKNGEEPQSVPFLILPDGRTRTGDDYTEEELRLCEYTGPYDVPTYDENFEIIQWDSENFEYKVCDVDDETCMKYIRGYRNYHLRISDQYMIEDFPISDTSKTKIKEYRHWLRNYPQKIESGEFEMPRTYDDLKNLVDSKIPPILNILEEI